MSLSRAVQQLVQKDNHVRDALRRNYGNISAIARLLKPKIEEMLDREVTQEGIITSLRRTKLNQESDQGNLKIIAESIINLRTDVAKISLEKSKKNLEDTIEALRKYQETFFQVLVGATKLTIIIDQSMFRRIRSVFWGRDVLDEKQNLAAIIVQSQTAIVDTPGCIATFYDSISGNQINIEETISCFTETIIIIRIEDAGKTFTILTDLIREARRTLHK